jgi:Ca2+-binding EF-hand superfamily protein
MKSFKYFDLNNNGTVEPDEFAKAIEKIGIMIPTREVSYLFCLFPPPTATVRKAPFFPPESKFKL